MIRRRIDSPRLDTLGEFGGEYKFAGEIRLVCPPLKRIYNSLPAYDRNRYDLATSIRPAVVDDMAFLNVHSGYEYLDMTALTIQASLYQAVLLW